MFWSCWAMTERTSTSILLNSSKQHQIPDWHSPEKNLLIICVKCEITCMIYIYWRYLLNICMSKCYCIHTHQLHGLDRGITETYETQDSNDLPDHLNRIWMQIRTTPMGFQVFECKIEPFQQDLVQTNANSNLSNGIWSIGMQMRTIRTGFKTLEFKVVPLERDSNHSNENLNHSKGIRRGFEAFECKFQPFEQNSKHWSANMDHLNGIWNIQMQIQTTPMRFKPIKWKFEPFKRDSKDLNAKSNHSNGIRGIKMHNWTIRTGFEVCKFEPLQWD